MRMRPDWLKTKIFIDSGDPADTKKALELIGFLDGQTTNPTLIAKNPEVKERLNHGEKFKREELLDFYKKLVQEISVQIPDGSVSIETYVNHDSTANDILNQAEEMNSWIPNAHIKIPVTHAGLYAANNAVMLLGIKVNMTLCFSQEQAAAIHAATRSVAKGDVFVSPFIGRLDDTGLRGVDLIENALKTYHGTEDEDSHVEVLAASVRNIYHLLHVLRLGVDIVTCPLKVLEEWVKDGFSRPGDDFHYNKPELKKIDFNQRVKLDRIWHEYNISHPLTDKGIELFCKDWNNLLREDD